MELEKALDLVESLLQEKTGTELTDPEKEILIAAWNNKTYNHIADSLYLSIGHIKDLASFLWKRLSSVMEVKVTKSNFRYLLEKKMMIDHDNYHQIEEIKIETDQANVLIVDDLVENLEFLTEILIKRGYKVRSVTNGNMALRTAINHPPDIILLDIKMPEMDGYEVCKAMKNHPSTSEIPIIFLSALDEVIDKIKAFQLGGVDYITKPFHPEEVIARMQTQITIQKQKIELRQSIYQHQQTVEILYQSRSLLASLLNNSLQGIAAIEALRNPNTGEIEDFIYVVVNPVFAELFGEKREKLTTMSGIKKLFDQLNPELFDILVSVVKTGKPVHKKFDSNISKNHQSYEFTIIKFGDGCSITGGKLYCI